MQRLWIFATAGLLASWAVGCGDMCSNEQVASVSSPSGAWKAVAFNRGCGATIGTSSQVSLLRSSEQLPNDGGNVLVLEAAVPLQLSWKSETELVIQGAIGVKAFQREQERSGVKLSYQ
jgi:hypothetical protein